MGVRSTHDGAWRFADCRSMLLTRKGSGHETAMDSALIKAPMLQRANMGI
jgi:hypothetical protein